MGRCSGLMVGAINSGVSSLGYSPGQEHCVVFKLGKNTFTLAMNLFMQAYKWVLANLMPEATL